LSATATCFTVAVLVQLAITEQGVDRGDHAVEAEAGAQLSMQQVVEYRHRVGHPGGFI
jgi:hypothetical protein